METKTTKRGPGGRFIASTTPAPAQTIDITDAITEKEQRLRDEAQVIQRTLNVSREHCQELERLWNTSREGLLDSRTKLEEKRERQEISLDGFRESRNSWKERAEKAEETIEWQAQLFDEQGLSLENALQTIRAQELNIEGMKSRDTDVKALGARVAAAEESLEISRTWLTLTCPAVLILACALVATQHPEYPRYLLFGPCAVLCIALIIAINTQREGKVKP
jgi:hypothetical protein